MKASILVLSLFLGLIPAVGLVAAPLGTAFNYQGRLEQNGQPGQPVFNGIYQMNFSLFAQAISGEVPLNGGV